MGNVNSIKALKKKAKQLINKNKILEALTILQPLCKSVPKDLEAWYLLADIYYEINQINDAEYCCNHILTIHKKHLATSQKLAMIYHRKKNYQLALTLYENSLKNNYEISDTLYLIGTVHRECGNNKRAQDYYERALEIKPEDFKTLNNLSEIYTSLGRTTDAIKLLNRAEATNPGHKFIINNLAKTYLILGNAEKASNLYRLLLNKEKVSSDEISNYLLSLNYLDDINPEFIFEEHKKWSKKFQNNIPVNTSLKSKKIDIKESIKIGILSADLKDHPVARFILSFLKYYTSESFNIYCYSDSLTADHVTKNIKQMCSYWRGTANHTNTQLTNLIIKDNIDIVFDLAGHTSGSRMSMLASRVAPIQMTYIGYPNTTGVKTIDYRITDNHVDPFGITDKFHTEELLRIDDSFLCYTPDGPACITEKPAESNQKNLVFGSFNNLAKTTPKVIETWCKILTRVPNSKLILKSQASSDIGVQKYFYTMFENHGIDRERVQFLASLPSKSDHLICYNDIDIGLDTFPYNGTTTTIEALWMSTPIISLCGKTHVSRVGYSILKSLGHPELSANTHDEYIELAISLANDKIRLKQLHHTIHESLKKSCILNHPSHTKKIEALLLGIIKKHNDSIR